MDEHDFTKLSRESNTIGKKLVVIIIFLLLLLIPLFCVENTVNSRSSFKDEAINNIAMSWAKSQKISAPELKLKNGECLTLENYNLQSVVKSDYRKKGIFKIPVYTTDIIISGTFTNPDLKTIDGTFILNFSDPTGLTSTKSRTVNNAKNNGKVYIANAPKNIPFEASYTIKGINSLTFETSAINNNIDVKGTGKNVNFEGDYLPSNKTINKGSFDVNWKILGMTPSLCPDVTTRECTILFEPPIDNYRMTIRTIKYGFMFLSLTFLAFFLFETASRIKPIHPFQYTLIGFSMIMFYMLLLSISEFTPFGLAYLIAVLMTIGLITGYTYFVLTNKDKNLAKTIGLILGILYLYLYTVLNLQDFALLIGTLGLFAAIIAIMYYTRNIKWYKES